MATGNGVGTGVLKRSSQISSERNLLQLNLHHLDRADPIRRCLCQLDRAQPLRFHHDPEEGSLHNERLPRSGRE